MVMNDFMLMCKNDLIMHLNLKFEHITTLNEVSNMSEQLEEETEKFIENIILTKTKRFFLNFSSNDQYMIDDNGNKYYLQIIPLLEQRDVLQIRVCRENEWCGNKLYTREACILGNGIRKKVIFVLSGELKLNKCELEDMVKVLYETAYSWFAIKIEEYVSDESVSVARTVYNFMRRVFCNDDIYKVFWIAVVGKGYGFRLLNLEQIKVLFSTFSSSANKYYSTNDYVGNLISTRLPYDKLLMKEALDYNEKINGNIANAKYTKEGNIYSKTMSALYKGNAFSIYPIISGDIGVVGLYPVEYKEEIENHLDARKVEITDIIQRELSKIDLAYKLFDDNYQEKWDIGIPDSVSGKGDITIMFKNTGKITEILEEYYRVYCDFQGKFVLDANVIYSDEELQYRKILEENGMIEKYKGGYCITEKGIRNIEGNASSDKIMQVSDNKGVVIIGDNNQLKKEVCSKFFIVNNREDIDRTIERIKETVCDLEEKEYVNTLLDLLEKQLKNSEPKKNIMETILNNLASISTISAFVMKLKELLFI